MEWLCGKKIRCIFVRAHGAFQDIMPLQVGLSALDCRASVDNCTVQSVTFAFGADPSFSFLAR